MIGVKDWFAPETMRDYFIRLYRNSSTFDKVNVKERLKPGELYFESVAKEFQLIDNNGRSVIVNYEDSMELVGLMKMQGISYNLMKQLSRYMVNLRECVFRNLFKEGLVEEILEGFYLLVDREQYDADTGVLMDNHWLEEILIQ